MLTTMTFGERLKQLRKDAGLSQDKLARAAGLSTSTVTKIEQQAIDPAWSTVEKLARALGVDCRSFQTEDAGQAEAPPANQAEPPPAKKKGKRKG